jgi:hypothetical protein
MLADRKVKCHRTGFTKTCRSLVDSGACTRWVQMAGADHEGKPVNHWDCIDNWSITVGLNTAQQVRQLAASVEGARNVLALMSKAAARQALPEQTPPMTTIEHQP